MTLGFLKKYNKLKYSEIKNYKILVNIKFEILQNFQFPSFENSFKFLILEIPINSS